jgi:hypothetical protein
VDSFDAAADATIRKYHSSHNDHASKGICGQTLGAGGRIIGARTGGSCLGGGEGSDVRRDGGGEAGSGGEGEGEGEGGEGENPEPASSLSLSVPLSHSALTPPSRTPPSLTPQSRRRTEASGSVGTVGSAGIAQKANARMSTPARLSPSSTITNSVTTRGPRFSESKEAASERIGSIGKLGRLRGLWGKFTDLEVKLVRTQVSVAELTRSLKGFRCLATAMRSWMSVTARDFSGNGARNLWRHRSRIWRLLGRRLYSTYLRSWSVDEVMRRWATYTFRALGARIYGGTCSLVSLSLALNSWRALTDRAGPYVHGIAIHELMRTEMELSAVVSPSYRARDRSARFPDSGVTAIKYCSGDDGGGGGGRIACAGNGEFEQGDMSVNVSRFLDTLDAEFEGGSFVGVRGGGKKEGSGEEDVDLLDMRTAHFLGQHSAMMGITKQVAAEICRGRPAAHGVVYHTAVRDRNTPSRWGIRPWAPNIELSSGKPSLRSRALDSYQPPGSSVSLGVFARTGGAQEGRGVGGGFGEQGQQQGLPGGNNIHNTGPKESKKKGDASKEGSGKATGASSQRHSFRSKLWYS